MSTATPTRLPKINHTGTGPTPAAHPTAPKLVEPAPTFFDPTLTPGQLRVLTAEMPRLFRMLDRRTPGATLAVVEILTDLRDEAVPVDAVIAAEVKRRRDTAAARPTLALAMRENRRTTT